jgi:integrase
MSGSTKYPILDPDFKLKMLGACRDDYERGLISLLWLTGMHPCIISKGERPRPEIIKEGPHIYIYWRRAKTAKRLREKVPKDMLEQIKGFLDQPPKSQRHLFNLVQAVGERAGYDGISPATLRHSRCLRGLMIEGYTIYEMAHKMGCTLDVVVRNYSVVKEEAI